MPKINVTEHDLSWYYRQRDPNALTVYMPILASQGPEEPTLCNISNFKATYGSEGTKVSGDISYDMAASFVEAGLNVLVHRVIPSGAEYAQAEIISGKVTVKTKFKGEAGNNYQIKGQKVTDTESDTKYKFYIKTGFGVSSIFDVDFTDVNSPDYYTVVNDTSDFVEFNIAEDQSVDASDSLISSDYIKFTGGLDYTKDQEHTVTMTEVISDITTNGFFEDLKDPYQHSFDIAVDGGFNDLKNTSIGQLSEVDKDFLNLVTTVKDAVYLTSGVPGMVPESFYSYCSTFSSSYVAAYGPWGYAQLLNSGEVKLLPGYYALLIAWANAISAGNPVWMAPAGIKRSQLGTFYRKPEYEIGKTILDNWQNQEEDLGADVNYKVNPIMKLKQYGYCIYGNATLMKSSLGTSSMLQTFSVRVLANQIKKQAFDISLSLQFDQLTPDLFVQFKTLLGVYMDQLKYNGALYDYDIVADYSVIAANTKTVPVTISISPNATAENFEIALEISQAGVSFADDNDNTELEIG